MRARRVVRKLARRFDRLSLRERLLITAAVLGVIFAGFNLLVLNRLEARKSQLSAQLNEIVDGINGTAAALSGEGSGAGMGELVRARSLSERLERTSRELDSASAGLIPPQRMVQVIHDVLDQQQGVVLVSLRTLPPYPLLTDKPDDGPYVHAVDLVLEGQYLDVLAYLRALEGSRWHFYWQSIDLDAGLRPKTQVRVRLGTVSARRDWIQL
jgi:MSHA biogenesis protein MshJ